MDWLYAIAGLLVVLVLAFLVGKTQNSKSTAVHVSVFAGSLLILLAIRFGFTRTWEFILLLLALTLSGLEHIPAWVICTVIGITVGLVLRYVLILIAQSIAELSQELERTNARIVLIQDSIEKKLDDIASRLPERDESDYL